MYICDVPQFPKYITFRDYLPTIQVGQLRDQLLDSLKDGDYERNFCESWAVEKIYEHLADKFDLDFEFTDTLPYDNSISYTARQRAVLDFDSWISQQYFQGDLVINQGLAYSCNIDNFDSDFNPDKWMLLGNQYDIFYVPLPYPIFSVNIQKQKGAFTKGFYNVGDIVWWNDHIYSCKEATIVPSDSMRIQSEFVVTGNQNIFPNDVQNGEKYWEDLGFYSLDAGTLPTVSPWCKGDNRNPSFVQCIIDLSIWRLHNRISPNNIPTLRVQNMESQFLWMKKMEDGKLQSRTELNQPTKSNSFRWGSKTKQNNAW